MFSSHVPQLSLNFVENVALQLFVLSVARVRAVHDSVCRSVLSLLEALLQTLVELLADPRRRGLLSLQRQFVPLDLPMELFSSVVVVVLHEAVRELGGTETEEADFGALLLLLVDFLADGVHFSLAVTLRGQAPFLVVLDELLQRYVLLFFLSCQIMRGHLFI